MKIDVSMYIVESADGKSFTVTDNIGDVKCACDTLDKARLMVRALLLAAMVYDLSVAQASGK